MKKSTNINKNIIVKCDESIESDKKAGLLVEVLQKMGKTGVKVFHEIFALRNCHSIYISQGTIAKRVRRSHTTVNKIIAYFVSQGLIKTYYRHAKTCEYELADIFKEKDIEKIIRNFLQASVYLSLALLFANYPLAADPAQLCFKAFSSFNFYSRQAQAAREGSPIPGGYYWGTGQWPYQQHYEGQVNEIVTLQEFTAWVTPTLQPPKKEETTETEMQAFTREQLEELATYPKEAVALANRRYAQAISAGKTFSNPFSYYVAVCKGYVKDNAAKQTPEKGSAQSSTPTSGPRAIWKSPTRTIPVETDFEWAYNVERILHQKIHIEKDPTYIKAAQYPNLKWSLISAQEQAMIMADIHQGCHCRQDIVPGLRLPGMTTNVPSHKGEQISTEKEDYDEVPLEAQDYEEVFI